VQAMASSHYGSLSDLWSGEFREDYAGEVDGFGPCP